ncbi:MAG TPA: hypothetical protein PKN33_01490 [Phycisphaerae bacterium]|nr:hypothetical protein [Phycisphaerae bacterium]
MSEQIDLGNSATSDALLPWYDVEGLVNELVLYDGQVDIVLGEYPQTSRATVSLCMTPRPCVRIMLDDLGVGELESGAPFSVSIPGDTRELKIHWGEIREVHTVNETRFDLEGIVEDHPFDPRSMFHRVVFHLINWPRFLGAPIRYPDGTTSACRQEWTIGQWRIVVDPILNLSEKEIDNERRRGYMISHVGFIERVDNQGFKFENVKTILDALVWVLSFCRGAWSMPCLFVGLNEKGDLVAESWRYGLVHEAGYVMSWRFAFQMETPPLLSGLLTRLNSEIWAEPIRLVMQWYMNSNTNHAPDITGAIVIQQAGLELLAWTLLVCDRKVLSEDGASGLPASDKLRLLLSSCRIPVEIPEVSVALRKIAKEYNWQDGPAALVGTRNAIVHATPTKRKRFIGKDKRFLLEVWALGQWYLDLVLLYVMNYRGIYSNRLLVLSRAAYPEELVPWVHKSEL